MEGLKMVGGLAWVIGIVLFLVEPLLGFVVLLVALLLSVKSVQGTKERRHQELLEAARRDQ